MLIAIIQALNKNNSSNNFMLKTSLIKQKLFFCLLIKFSGDKRYQQIVAIKITFVSCLSKLVFYEEILLINGISHASRN